MFTLCCSWSHITSSKCSKQGKTRTVYSEVLFGSWKYEPTCSPLPWISFDTGIFLFQGFPLLYVCTWNSIWYLTSVLSSWWGLSVSALNQLINVKVISSFLWLTGPWTLFFAQPLACHNFPYYLETFNALRFSLLNLNRIVCFSLHFWEPPVFFHLLLYPDFFLRFSFSLFVLFLFLFKGPC